MVDRLAPFLILLLNQFVLGFVPLFGLAIASDELLPRLGPCLVALAIWSVPDLVRLNRSAQSEARSPLLYKVVIRSIRAGHLALLAVLVPAATGAFFFRPFPWHIAGFAAFLVAGFFEARSLRRQLDNLSVLDAEA